MSLDPRDEHVLTVVSSNLRAARARTKLSQADVAYAAGIQHQSLVSELENGRSARLVTYVRVARALDMPLGKLFEGLEDA